jgi:hypothetical protein
MSTKLISFYQNNPPDLKQREYLRGLGLKYSDAEVGEAQVGRMLALPPAGPSSIVKTDSQNAMRQWLSKSASSTANDLSHEVGELRTTVPKDAVSPPPPLPARAPLPPSPSSAAAPHPRSTSWVCASCCVPRGFPWADAGKSSKPLFARAPLWHRCCGCLECCARRGPGRR